MTEARRRHDCPPIRGRGPPDGRAAPCPLGPMCLRPGPPGLQRRRQPVPSPVPSIGTMFAESSRLLKRRTSPPRAPPRARAPLPAGMRRAPPRALRSTAASSSTMSADSSRVDLANISSPSSALPPAPPGRRPPRALRSTAASSSTMSADSSRVDLANISSPSSALPPAARRDAKSPPRGLRSTAAPSCTMSADSSRVDMANISSPSSARRPPPAAPPAGTRKARRTGCARPLHRRARCPPIRVELIWRTSPPRRAPAARRPPPAGTPPAARRCRPPPAGTRKARRARALDCCIVEHDVRRFKSS